MAGAVEGADVSNAPRTRSLDLEVVSIHATCGTASSLKLKSL